MNWLDEIIARKRSDIAEMRAEKFRARAEQRHDFRDFRGAIRRGKRRVRIIAEAKSASPSAGVIAANYDPAQIAKRYQVNGADAISVLTEQNYFRGGPEHLTAVREAVTLPILRKDFIIDERQILESVAIGADAILLIVAALKPTQLSALHDCAGANNLSVLVEVHTLGEIGMAVDAGAKIIGINNRNLTTLEVDLANTEKLVPEIPDGITIVSESGIRTASDLKRMAALPVDALLVGEGLMRDEISIKDL
ncbi:MAG TPA: indole-3-glycerol phosphate synthase TrpC [Chthoniobacterales bacterium]|nr:indole-3-glycerol phosphate synthase TrpC [Chthoniobacterales bacterium]